MLTVVVMHSVGLQPIYKSAGSKGSMGVSAASLTHSPRTTVVAVSTSTYLRVTYYGAIFPMPGKPKVGPMPPSAVKFVISVMHAPISDGLGKHNFSLWFIVTIFANRFYVVIAAVSSPFSPIGATAISSREWSPSKAAIFAITMPSVTVNTVVFGN